MAEITSVYGGRASIRFHNKGRQHYYVVSVPALKIYDLFQPSVTAIIGKLDKSGALVNWAVNSMYERTQELLALTADPLEREEVLALLNAAKNTWRDIKDDTANVGSVVHRVLEQELNARAGIGTHPVLPIKADPVLAPGLTAEMLGQVNRAVMAGFQFFDEHHIEILEAEGVRWSPKYGFLGTGDLIARVDGDPAVLDYKTGKRLYPTVFLQLAAYQMAYQEEHPEIEITRRIGVNVGRDGILETKERDNLTLKSDFSAFLGLLRAWRWDTENTDYKPKPAPMIVGSLDNLTTA